MPQLKSDAQGELGQVRPAFEKRIDDGNAQSGGSQQASGLVKENQQRSGHHAQRREQAQRLAEADHARGEGPVSGAFHVGVHLAVGDVVDHASGRPHEESTEHEYRQQHGGRKAAGCEPERGQGRPEKQQRADGPVEAHEAEIRAGMHCSILLRFQSSLVH